MKQGLFLALVLSLTLITVSPAPAAPPQAGEAFPPLNISTPTAAADVKYLGLNPGAKSFRLDQVKAQVVLVEVFSMYCTICQAEAPRMNDIYGMVEKRGLAGKFKVLGLGAGNSDYEVGVFKKKYGVAFPTLPDGDYAIHKSLGEPRTPLLFLVKLGGGKSDILYTHLGPLGEPQAFLDSLLDKAGMK